MLKAIDVDRNSKLISGVLDVWTTVLPPYERIPAEVVLRLIELHDYVTLSAYLDETADETPENVLGMSYVIDTPGLPFAYLLYLGVRPEAQGKGVGSEILDIIKARTGQPILLDVEPIDDPDAENKQQRQDRWRFYQRNGFEKTDLIICYKEEVFQVLVSGFDVTADQVDALCEEKAALFYDPCIEDAWE